MSFLAGLINTCVIEKRSTAPDETGEEVEVFIDGATIPAAVQYRAAQTLAMPDVDGPVLSNAVIFTLYRTDIAHLDRLRQTDVSPVQRFLVIDPQPKGAPSAPRHHLEVQAQRLLTTEQDTGS